MARQAAVSSEIQRVIYSLLGGERAGDPEKAMGQGDLGHQGAKGWWEEVSTVGWVWWVTGPHGSPTSGGFWGLLLFFLQSGVLPTLQRWCPMVPRHLGMEHSALLPFHRLGLGSTGDRGSTETPFSAVSWSRGHRFHACSHSGGDEERLLGASTNSPSPTLLQNGVCCCRWLSGQL